MRKRVQFNLKQTNGVIKGCQRFCTKIVRKSSVLKRHDVIRNCFFYFFFALFWYKKKVVDDSSKPFLIPLFWCYSVMPFSHHFCWNVKLNSFCTILVRKCWHFGSGLLVPSDGSQLIVWYAIWGYHNDDIATAFIKLE